MAETRSNKTQNETERGLSRRDETLTTFALFDRIADEMDRTFGRVFRDFGFGQPASPSRGLFSRRGNQALGAALWVPRVEAFQKDDRFVVRAELPGLKKDDVHAEVTEDVIVVQGERREEHEEQREGYRETAYGRFYREIPLPEGVEASEVKAAFSNGVLEITMQAAPAEANRGRRLEIKE